MGKINVLHTYFSGSEDPFDSLQKFASIKSHSNSEQTLFLVSNDFFYENTQHKPTWMVLSLLNGLQLLDEKTAFVHLIKVYDIMLEIFHEKLGNIVNSKF